MRAAIAVLLALVGPALAESPFDGSYLSSPTADCTLGAVEGGALNIAEGEFTGIGATCDMTRPVNVRDMKAVLYDMSCAEGDRTWTDRAMLMEAADGGLILVWDGYALKYDRCPEAPAENTVTRAQDLGVSDAPE